MNRSRVFTMQAMISEKAENRVDQQHLRLAALKAINQQAGRSLGYDRRPATAAGAHGFHPPNLAASVAFR